MRSDARLTIVIAQVKAKEKRQDADRAAAGLRCLPATPPRLASFWNDRKL
jgi:hypothetical protein